MCLIGTFNQIKLPPSGRPFVMNLYPKARRIAHEATAPVYGLLEDVRSAVIVGIREGTDEWQRPGHTGQAGGIEDVEGTVNRRSEDHVAGGCCEHGALSVNGQACRCLRLHTFRAA